MGGQNGHKNMPLCLISYLFDNYLLWNPFLSMQRCESRVNLVLLTYVALGAFLFGLVQQGHCDLVHSCECGLDVLCKEFWTVLATELLLQNSFLCGSSGTLPLY